MFNKKETKDSAKKYWHTGKVSLLMKRLSIIVLLVLAICSCNRKFTMVNKPPEVTGGYDTSLYNQTYSEAIRQKLLGNPGDAIGLFEKAAEINPRSDGSYYEISTIAYASKDPVSARKYILKALEIDDSNFWYLNMAANLYYNKPDPDSAALYYRKIIENYPKKDDIKLALSSVYLESNQGRKAEMLLEELYQKYGNNKSIMIPLMTAKRLQGKTGETEILLNKLINDNPEDINLKGLLAELYKATGKIEEADSLYGIMYSEKPGNATLISSYFDFLSGAQRYAKAKEIFEEGLKSKNLLNTDALNIFSNILKNDTLLKGMDNEIPQLITLYTEVYKDSTQGTLLMADYWWRKGNTRREIEILEKYIETDEDQYFIWEKLLLALSDSQDNEKLYKYSKVAAQKFNTSPLFKLVLANAAANRGEYDLAFSELNKVRIITNEFPDVMIQVYSLEGDLFYKKKEYKKSYDSFDKALQLDPKNSLVLNNYAYYLAENGSQIEKARKMIEKCLETEKNSTYLDTYAWVLFKEGKMKEALRIMNEVFNKYHVEDADVMEHYGYILEVNKECEKAIFMWENSIKLDPEKKYLEKDIERCKSTGR